MSSYASFRAVRLSTPTSGNNVVIGVNEEIWGISWNEIWKWNCADIIELHMTNKQNFLEMVRPKH